MSQSIPVDLEWSKVQPIFRDQLHIPTLSESWSDIQTEDSAHPPVSILESICENCSDVLHLIAESFYGALRYPQFVAIILLKRVASREFLKMRDEQFTGRCPSGASNSLSE